MSEEKAFEALTGNYAKPGKVEWIGLRPAKSKPLLSTSQAGAVKGLGLEGDHALNKAPGGKRQVTLIQKEHIGTMEMLLGKENIDPGQLRRNIVVSGINLHGLKEQRIKIGKAVLEISGPCHPCSRMEENLGKGGYSAMRGHGGWCARVIESGDIGIGDEVRPD